MALGFAWHRAPADPIPISIVPDQRIIPRRGGIAMPLTELERHNRRCARRKAAAFGDWQLST